VLTSGFVHVTPLKAMKDAGTGLVLAESEEESTEYLTQAMGAFDAANERDWPSLAGGKLG
jgi:hypothetical protein